MLDIDTFSHFIEDNNLIEKKDRIVLGVSGGADSICLLHTLSRIQKALEIRLFVVHINHGIRGEEASRDENYVKKFCEKLDIYFFSFHYDIPRIAKDLKLSEEEAGRKMRYESFESVSKDIAIKENLDFNKIKVAVAHNKNDNAETVLHNLSRGSGVSGLKGILVRNKNIIRHSIDYMTDSTNLENDYTRNILRNEVFPILEKSVNGNVINNFYKSSKIVAEADEFFENSAIKFCEKNLKIKGKDEFLLDKEALLNEPHIISTYIIRCTLRKVLKSKELGIKDIGMVHIEDIWNLAKSENGKKLDLKYGIKVYNEYGNIRFVNEEKKGTDNDKYVLPEINYKILDNFNIKDIPKAGNIRWLDFDKVLENIVKYNRKSICINSIINKDDMIKIIEENIVVRGCESGDFIHIKSGRKAVKKLFTDDKIPLNIRGEYVVVAMDFEILWIFRESNIFGEEAGLDRTGELYRIDENTKNILEIEVSRR